jgi:hypothetical protein
LWLDETYLWLAPHLAIVFLSQIIALPSSCSNQSLIGMGRVGTVALLQFIAMVAAVGALVFGALVLNLGFWSITVSLVVNSVIRGMGSNIAGTLCSKLSFWKLLWHSVLRPLAPGAPVLLLAWFLAGRLSIGSWQALIPSMAASALVMGLVYLVTLNQEDRQLARAVVGAVVKKLRGRSE